MLGAGGVNLVFWGGSSACRGGAVGSKGLGGAGMMFGGLVLILGC